MAVVNWKDLQKAAGDAGFDPLPVGFYDVIVDTAEATQSGSGKDMIKTTFRVEGGPFDGKKVFNQFVISPENANALAFFFRHMAAMGLNDAFFAAEPRTEQVASALIGRRARIKVSIRQWNEQDRNNVDQVLPPQGGAPAAPTLSAAPIPGGIVANGPGNTPVVAPAALAPSVSPTPSPAAPPPPPPGMPAVDDLPF